MKMSEEHSSQCTHIDHTIGEQVKSLSDKIDYNSKITEGIVHQVSGIDSSLKALDKKVDEHYEEMKPLLEAKVGIKLMWRFLLGVPVVVAIFLGFKTLLGWFGFHK